VVERDHAIGRPGRRVEELLATVVTHGGPRHWTVVGAEPVGAAIHAAVPVFHVYSGQPGGDAAFFFAMMSVAYFSR
jgi:hypothetical protein